jgi:hypothetical protein
MIKPIANDRNNNNIVEISNGSKRMNIGYTIIWIPRPISI